MKEIIFKDELLLEDIKNLSKILTYLKENMKSIHILALLEENNLQDYYLKISNFLNYLETNKLKKVYQHLFFDEFEKEKKGLSRKSLKIANKIEKMGLRHISTVSGARFLENEYGRKYIKEAILSAKGFFYRSIKELLEENKDKELKEIYPTILFRDGLIKKGDIVIFSKFLSVEYEKEIEELIKIFQEKEVKIEKIKFI